MSSSILSTPTYQALAANIKNADGTTPLYLSGAWTFQNASAQTTLSINSSGNIGIGTTSQTLKLEVSNGTNTGYVHPGVSIGLSVGTKNNSILTLDTNNSERMRIDGTGVITVGTGVQFAAQVDMNSGRLNFSEDIVATGYYSNLIHHKCTVSSGYRQHSAIGVYRPLAADWGDFYIATGGNDSYTTTMYKFRYTGAAFQGNNSASWSTTSDERIKQNIRSVNNCLQKIIGLNPVHFEYIDKPEKIKTGFIAQEFEKILPGHVNEHGCSPEIIALKPELKNQQIKSIDADLIPYLVGAIKEQQVQIEQLKSEVEFLRDKLSP